VTRDLHTALDAIDNALGDHPREGRCQQCTQPLADSPAADFCSEDCQHAWYETTTGAELGEGRAAPDAALPETAPVRPLSWLGQPPSGAYVRAGHELLDAVAAFVSRFSVFPDQHCAPTLALWYAHTHAVDQFYVTPRLILDSAEPGSGKTRVLEVAQYLVAAPEMTISATTAALFRLVSMGPITILFDEVDAIFNPKTAATPKTSAGCSTPGTNAPPPSPAASVTRRT